jgi:hypothetical protein
MTKPVLLTRRAAASPSVVHAYPTDSDEWVWRPGVNATIKRNGAAFRNQQEDKFQLHLLPEPYMGRTNDRESDRHRRYADRANRGCESRGINPVGSPAGPNDSGLSRKASGRYRVRTCDLCGVRPLRGG